MSNTICYEFPLTKTMRLFLRFEQLMAQFNTCVREKTTSGTISVLTTISDIYQLTMHIDLKAEVIREIDRMVNQLPSIDNSSLQNLDETRKECIKITQNINGPLGQHLKNHYLFNLIRQRLSMPGGVNPFDLPVSHYWFNQPHEKRQELLLRWVMPYLEINKAVKILLASHRALQEEKNNLAKNGYFQQTLDPSKNFQILQIVVDDQIESYPEISSGRQRITIRFFDLLDPSKHANQSEKDIEFLTRFCI